MTERQRLARLLRFSSTNRSIDRGKQVHAALVRIGYGSDLILNNDLIDLYGKCGRMDMSCAVFDKMPERNVVSWTALMCGHLQQGNPKSTLLLFRRMGYSDIKPNEFTFSTNFKACSFLNIPANGMQIHGLCARTGFEWFPVVANSIMDMYSRCGRITEAAQMFDLMPIRSLISWNAMIAGYALEGMGDQSLLLFQKMQKQGEIPDDFYLYKHFKGL